MKEIFTVAYLRIHEGKTDEFKAVAGACKETVREKDKGTLQYDWFFDRDEKTCVVHERYADSDAMLEHMGNLGDILGRLLGMADLSLELYGAPSEEILQAVEGMDVKVFGYFQGLKD